MARVLVVEDDRRLGGIIREILRAEGHEVVVAEEGARVEDVAREARPDLILLDIGLPDLGGVEVCRRLRRWSRTPIIFLTGRDDQLDKVVALDAGGDDYVVKPFRAMELTARIRAVLRRAEPLSGPSLLSGGGVELDVVGRRVFVDGEEVELTAREFDLLRLLMRHPNETLGRQEIFDAVWGPDFVGDETALNVYTRRLRQKIERRPDHPPLIQTVRGVGYRFTVPTPVSSII